MPVAPVFQVSAASGAVVEIWQADHAGIYLHPREGRLAQRDTGFQGYGRVRADAEGRYAFRTIRPGQYPGRTPHIHLRAHPPAGGPAGRRLGRADRDLHLES